MTRQLVSSMVLACLWALPTASLGQASGRFELVRSTSGSRGTQDGKGFVIEDPRVEFQAGKDRQVLVLFEWRGPVGHHRCEGTWKDPGGRPVFTSQAEVDARTARFGIYWGLSIPDSVAIGTWVLEARVDGEPAGSHSFQVVAGSSLPVQAARRFPTVAELYKLAQSETMRVEVADAAGRKIANASGFFISPEILVTSFGAINGGRSVGAVRANGTRLETSEILGWNGREDWALLRVAGAASKPPARSGTALQVGDRCFFLDVDEEGARVIVDTAVIGVGADGDLMIGQYGGEASYGGPVWNDQGEVVAFLAGGRVAGATAFDLVGTSLGRGGATTRGMRARPVPKLPVETAVARRLEDLAAGGVFVTPVAQTPHFVSGTLGTGIDKMNGVPIARDQRLVFGRADRECIAFVTWNPASKEDALAQFAVYDADNKLMGTSTPQKLKLRSGQPIVQYWTMALTSLKPGLYRIDLMKGQEPVWRTFFRLAD